MPAKRFIVVMGPSGCGKSTIGAMAAARLKGGFVEADDYHSRTDRARMAGGQGLTDADRLPWIARVATAARESEHRVVVIACSALSQTIRHALQSLLGEETRFVLLDVPEDVLRTRLQERTGHFAGPSLLQGQLSALDRSGVAHLDGTKPKDALASELTAFGLDADSP